MIRRRLPTFLALAAATALIAGAASGVLEGTFFRIAASVVAAGLAFRFAIAVARRILGFERPIISVARNVLDEAVRRRTALLFLLALLVLLSVLPLVVGHDAPLRYRLQSFLSHGFAATGFLASCLTIFLACGTLSGEIEGRQIYTVAVKPIGRGAYLAGKWLGIVVFDAVLLSVAGVALWGFAVLYIARLEPADDFDAAAVRDAGLVARQESAAGPALSVERRVNAQLRQLLAERPQAIRDLGRDEAAARGLTRLDENETLALGTQRARQQLAEHAERQAFGIGPLRTETYVFPGLESVPRDANVQLRYRVAMPRADERDGVPVVLSIGGESRVFELALGRHDHVSVPAERIDSSGRLQVSIRNPSRANPTIVLRSADGLEVLWKVGGFAPNLVRCLAAVWIKLAFLAMLGLLAATFLGFPVACLATFVVLFVAMTSPLLLEAVEGGLGGHGHTHGPATHEEEAGGLYYDVSRALAITLSTVLGKFAEFDPGQRLVDGRVFGWGRLAACFLWLGVVWTGLTAAIGIGIFRARELARVQA